MTETNFVEVNGLKVAFLEWGRGSGRPVVLFLHGWGARKDLFEHSATHLWKEAGAHVIALDFPGFGESERQQVVWKVDDYVSFVQSFLDAVSVQAVDLLIGHSHGGRVALKSAVTHPPRFRKLLLIGSAGIKNPLSMKKWLRVKTFKFCKFVLQSVIPAGETRERLLGELRASFGSADYKDAGPLRDTLVALLQEDLTPILPNIQQPTLLVWGGEDRDTPLENGKKMESLIPDAGLVVWEGASHYAFLDRPDAFNRVALSFLTGE